MSDSLPEPRNLWQQLLMVFVQPCQQFCGSRIVCLPFEMKETRRVNDQVNDIRKTPAATALLVHCVEQLARDNQLPAIIVQHFANCIANVRFGDKVAATNKHLE